MCSACVQKHQLNLYAKNHVVIYVFMLNLPLSKCNVCAQEHQLKICELALVHPHLPEMACVVAVVVHYQTAEHALLLLGMPVSRSIKW
jgi:hypothetical protein